MRKNRTPAMNTPGYVVERNQDWSSPFLVFHLSWVAYVREIWAFLVRLLLCIVVFSVASMTLDRFAGLHTEPWLPVAGPMVATTWTIYSVMLTKSVRLIADENGVWMHSGVFAWEKGYSGMQWRDLGQAGYSQGMASWLLRSYHIQISHRFITGAGLRLRHVRHGNLAVEHINGIMAQLQGRMFQR